ncbi:MAG: hypothetical protein OXI38_13405, partial [Bacteroidota bacterium]|nr:hypothetical protein [Bacteroidota bacterium]
MEHLLTQYIPHASKLGLHVRPTIPRKLVRNAVRDYVPDVPEDEVVVLYDNTWLRNGKDGAVFTAEFLVFQNSNLERPQLIRYGEIVHAAPERKRLGGAVLHLDVNTGRATITETMDFGARPKALDYVYKFEALAKRVNHGVLPISRFAGRATPQPPCADAPASEAIKMFFAALMS